jgi:hypothetical protein
MLPTAKPAFPSTCATTSLRGDAEYLQTTRKANSLVLFFKSGAGSLIDLASSHFHFKFPATLMLEGQPATARAFRIGAHAPVATQLAFQLEEVFAATGTVCKGLVCSIPAPLAIRLEITRQLLERVRQPGVVLE